MGLYVSLCTFVTLVLVMFFNSVFLLFCLFVYLIVFVLLFVLFWGGHVSMNTYVIAAVSISGLSMIPKNLWKTKTIRD